MRLPPVSLARTVLVTALALSVGGGLSANGINWDEGLRLRGMLKDSYETVKRFYFAPAATGPEWDARYEDYRQRISAASSFSAGLGIVGAFLGGLNDSHTFFQPPPWTTRADYGYDVGIVGDEAFIVRVRPGTDAATRLRAGDRVISINGNEVTRESIGRMQYILTKLAPQRSTRVVVRTQTGETRTELVAATVTAVPGLRLAGGPADAFVTDDLMKERDKAQRLVQQRAVEMGPVMFWKLPTFFMEVSELDSMIAKAHKHETLVLDLRGNPGGLVSVLQRLVGSMFKGGSVIGTRITRAGNSLLTAPGRGAKAFEGKLIVLIDSGSGSSSELFARVVQLDERGTVMGDRSAGVVREGRLFPFSQGDKVVLPYAIAVTNAEIVMKNGESLEGTGVTPDYFSTPSPADLASGGDPVLARAAALAGIALDSMSAARLFGR